MIQRAKRFFAVLLLGCTLAALFTPGVLAAEDEKPYIRVGIIASNGYAQQNADGSLSGVNVEYAYRIAQYANVNIRVTLLKSGKDAIQMLDGGQIDMMCDVIKTPDREEKYLFSQREVGEISMCVYTAEDDRRFTYNNLEQLKTMTFGAEEVSKVRDVFTAWCREHGFEPEIRLYQTSDEIKAAIKDGSVDAGLYGSTAVEGFRTIQKFASQPYYFLFRKNDGELKSKVDDAMSGILSEDTLYFEKLVQKYTVNIEYGMEALSTEELSYVQAHPLLTVAVVNNDAPYYDMDKNGNASGILPDFYAKITALTGLQFSYRVYATQEEAIEAVKSGQTDVLGVFSDGQITANDQGLRITRAYSYVDAVLLTRSENKDQKIKTFAAKKRSLDTIRSFVDQIYQADFVGYDTVGDCFSALRRGEVDAIICGLPSATWLINQNLASAYNIRTISSGSLALCSATAYDNSTLSAILGKAIRAASYSFNEIEMNNTLPQNNVETAISRIPPVRLAIVFAVILLVMFLCGWAVLTLQRRQKDRAVVLAQRAENARRENEIAVMEKAAASKNQFFSGISHDMRTPLNAILGFSSLAEETAASPQTRDYLEKIQASGRLLLELINDTLIISKANSGKLEVHPEAVAWKDIIDSVTVPVSAAAAKKQITLTVDTSHLTQQMIQADKLDVQKILLNLLTNAVRYTPEGGHVDFSVKNISASDGFDTVIAVRDDGIGMSEEFQKHLFEPFAQEYRMGYESKGTGLGLSIVKQLVDLMGGTVEVHSAPGKGTEFLVNLRFQAVKPSDTGGKGADKGKNLSALRGRRALLCEDNALNSEIACAMLRSKGMEIVTAPNGQVGLKTFEKSEPGTFDVILMDLRMPVLDGFGAARAIRALDRPDAGHVPIIAITADAFDEDMQKCTEAGMNAHVAKPISPERLFDAILSLIGEK